jgi:type IV secretory pathway protease TraF
VLFRSNEDCDLNRPNGIYVMGDNINHSEDSRDYGPVTASDVYGKVLGR